MRAWMQVLWFALRLIGGTAVVVFVMLAMWLEPATGWLDRAADVAREVLPKAPAWSLTRMKTSADFFAYLDGYGWRGLGRWFDETPWPAGLVLLIVVVRCIAWRSVRWWRGRMDDDDAGGIVRLAGVVETLCAAGWAAAGSAAWRVWWAVQWDWPITRIGQFFPIADDPWHKGALWLGAAIGYAWTLNLVAQRVASRRRERRCAACGYLLRGLEQPCVCPECGGDESAPRPRGRVAHVWRVLWRYSGLAAAILLLAAPYLSTLIAGGIRVLHEWLR